MDRGGFDLLDSAFDLVAGNSHPHWITHSRRTTENSHCPQLRLLLPLESNQR